MTALIKVGAQTISHDLRPHIVKRSGAGPVLARLRKSGMADEEAIGAIERLVAAGLEAAAGRRLGVMTQRVARIFELRTQLTSSLSDLLRIRFDKAVPIDLATTIRKLFADLDIELAALTSENRSALGDPLSQATRDRVSAEARTLRTEINRLGDKVRVDTFGQRLVWGSEDHLVEAWLQHRRRDPAHYPNPQRESPPQEYRDSYFRVGRNRVRGSKQELRTLGDLGVAPNPHSMTPREGLNAADATWAGVTFEQAKRDAEARGEPPPAAASMGRRPAEPFEPFRPDGVVGNPSELIWGFPYEFVEVKDWGSMSNTGNVRAMLTYLESHSNCKLKLAMREGAKMSGPLSSRIRDRVKAGQIEVWVRRGEPMVKLLPGDPELIRIVGGL